MEVTPEYIAWRNKSMARFWALLEPMMWEAWLEAHGEEIPPSPPIPPVPGPEPSDYDGGRIRVVWATGTTPSMVQSKLQYGDHTYAIVVTADVKNMQKEGMAEIRNRIADARSKGIKVYAYVRAPVHMRVNEQWTLNNVSPNVPFEHAVGELVKQRNAYAFDAAGKPIFHPGGYDVYLNPTLIAEEHASLVMQYAWDADYFDGILADGLVTNQPYAWAANFTLDEQYAALSKWAFTMDAPIVGNGSWEPAGGDYYPWPQWIQGAMDEDMTHPQYHPNDPSIQTPPLSERWAMHMKCAQAWAGREYFIGDNLRLFNLPEEQRRRFLIASALMVDAKVVMKDHEWLRLKLGRPTGRPHYEGYSQGGVIQNWFMDDHINHGGNLSYSKSLKYGSTPIKWERHFEGGTVSCFPDRMDGEIEY